MPLPLWRCFSWFLFIYVRIRFRELFRSFSSSAHNILFVSSGKSSWIAAVIWQGPLDRTTRVFHVCLSAPHWSPVCRDYLYCNWIRVTGSVCRNSYLNHYTINIIIDLRKVSFGGILKTRRCVSRMSKWVFFPNKWYREWYNTIMILLSNID